MRKYNKHILVFFLLLVVGTTVFGQQRHSNSRWKQNRYDLIFGLGATSFLGELGGADQIGTNFVRDLEISQTRPLGSFGIRYKLLENVAIRYDMNFGILRGDDKTTTNAARNNRNIHFRAQIFETSFVGEYSITRERVGSIYNLRKVRGLKGIKSNIYLFAGIAGFYFNPQGQYTDGKWYSLQPLGTEGQGIVPTREPYSRIGVAIPVGVGLKYAFNRKMSIGFDYGVRKTFTDYIDDTSTTYVDKDLFNDPIAQHFSDPSIGPGTGPGQQRGDSFDNDAYMFLKITLTYKMRNSRSGMPKF
jgi:hypothetical protein